MNQTPQERLARLVRHAREGWRVIQSEPGARERALRWLAEHPSARPEVDRLWLDCLSGAGLLAEWLASGGRSERWSGSPPLHTVLASHPFPDLKQWSMRAKFRRS
jgi:hypothetical protein